VNGGLERDDVCALVAAGNEALRFIQCVFVDADDAAGLYDEWLPGEDRTKPRGDREVPFKH
jgi:hypothetical protein